MFNTPWLGFFTDTQMGLITPLEPTFKFNKTCLLVILNTSGIVKILCFSLSFFSDELQ